MIKHPQEKGSHWKGKTGLYHGPRIMQPKAFKKFYLKDPEWVRKNQERIENYDVIKGIRLPENTKVVTGVLKKNKRLAIQSFIGMKLPKVRVKAHRRRQKGRRVIVHSFYRRIHKSKRF
jgi:hypothetical protein